jgi:hypothetical protein
MKILHFTIAIHAARNEVWDTMLAPDTYRDWTSAFAEGSYYEGSWEKSGKIRFLGPTGDGMFSRIVENRKHEYMQIEHLGFLQGGIEIRASPEARAWAGAKEAYTFSEKNGVTTVDVDVDTAEEMEADFSRMWPEALARLKALCEKRA